MLGDHDRIPSHALWTAYAVAFFARYGVHPVRNAKVNSQIKQIAQRLPAEHAVSTVSHYVRSQHQVYLAARHSVGMMLRDCEGLCMEAQTGRMGTGHAARAADKRAGRGDEYAEMLARLDAEDREHGDA